MELMTRGPFRGRRPFFIGDDVTDESVFAIMPDLDGLASPLAAAPVAWRAFRCAERCAGISRASARR